MDQFTKEGRKLRPRKTAQSTVSAERVEYRSENHGYGERRPRTEGKPYGERRPYGEGRSQGERRQYGEHRQFNNNGEHRSYSSNGEHKQYGGNGENRQYDKRERRPGTGYGKPFQKQDEHSQRPGKNFGPKRKAAPKANVKKKAKFSKESYEGIKKMIDRRPVVNGNASEEQFISEIKDVVRLNKFIANSGVCSRREAETLIQAGVVTVNGEVVTELGTKVNIYTDDIRFNGERLRGEEKVYLIMNKPKGYVTTASDPHADKTVIDLVKGCPSRVYPVGRLDKNTTGVLLLTNDGEIAERLTHPSYDKKKIYQVSLDKELSEDHYKQILEGVTLTDGEVKADELEYIDPKDKRKIGIEIHSGKNRIVRRIFDSLGYNVKALDRVYFAGLTKKGLKKGEWRYLTEGEVNILKIGAYV